MRTDDDPTGLGYDRYIGELAAIGAASGMSPADAAALAHEVLAASLAHPWRIIDRRQWLTGAMEAAVEHHRRSDV